MCQIVTGINTLVLDEHIPTPDDRDENGRGDGKDTNKEKENIASHQNQLPAHVQRFMAKEVCPVDMKPAGAKKRDEERAKVQNKVASQYKMSNSKEIGVGLSAWSFKHVVVEACQCKQQKYLHDCFKADFDLFSRLNRI